MKQTRILMDMPITVEIIDEEDEAIFTEVFSYFTYIDSTFSPFKTTSEISNINDRKILKDHYSDDMMMVLRLCEETKYITNGYFDIQKNGKLDPCGLVKGWAIRNVATSLKQKGYSNFYVDAGGDIEMSGVNSERKSWTVGIRNPFCTKQIIKILSPKGKGVATSGTYERGTHIYNPKQQVPITDIVSLTVIGPDVFEADRFATAAFAMGDKGIHFIESLSGFEGYMINARGIATYTSGFERFVLSV
jgi:thiamine biosynthesis lipoprotein